MRITRAHLEAKVHTINVLTNSPVAPYSKDADGKHICNVGNYHISNNHYGYSLYRMSGDGGGVSHICNITLPASTFADFLTGLIEGIVIGKSMREVR